MIYGPGKIMHLLSSCLVLILNLLVVDSTTSTHPSTTTAFTSTSFPNTSTDIVTLPETFLLFTEYFTGSMYLMDATTQTYVKIPVKRINRPSAIDYDPVDKNIYFLDNANHEIRQVSITGNAEQTVLDLGDGEYNGIAVDPISRLIFYTSHRTPFIGVVAIDGFDHTILIDSGQHVLWDIAVDAKQGMMYWTQCCGTNGKIRRALYDGSEIEDITTSYTPYPYAIALDTVDGRIYWAESLREVIEYSFLNGSNKQLLYKGTIRNCLGMALLNDNIYYAVDKSQTLIRIQIDQKNAIALTPRNFSSLRGVHAHNGSAPSESNVCTNGKGGCSHICIPFKGDKKCLCPTGQSLLHDAVSCACPNRRWGVNCSHICECDVNNTVSCASKTGCVCRSGFTGANCTEDIDECYTVMNVCPSNSDCSNNAGSFSCVCFAGYSMNNSSNGTMICEQCSGNTFGTNCSTTCDCIKENTLNTSQSCDYISGHCNCLEQWTGKRCERDVDECSVGLQNCTNGNEKCINFDGGFRCICEDDFFRNTGGYCEMGWLPVPHTPLTFERLVSLIINS